MLVIRDLLNHDEKNIKLGRINESQAKGTTDYIVVDSISASQPITKSKAYNGDTEKLKVSSGNRMPITVDFYGTNAYTNANKFQILLKTDKARWLQKDYKISIGAVSGITDVKQLTGQQYTNRYQVSLMVTYTESVVIGLLRIDTAITEIQNEEGILNG